MTEEIQNWELKTEREEAIRALPRIAAALESIAESLRRIEQRQSRLTLPSKKR